MEFSTLVGLAMVAASLVVFALALPWGGQVRIEGMHAPLLMVLMTVIFVGAAFALMGFPEPTKFTVRR
jgi:hypothetical protein